MSAALADSETEAPAVRSWRDPDIETLSLTKLIIDRLRAYKIEHVGALADAIDNGSEFGLGAFDLEDIRSELDRVSGEISSFGDIEADDDPDATVLIDELPAAEAVPQPASEGAEPPAEPPVATAAPDPEDDPDADALARMALIRERREQELHEYDRETNALIVEEEEHVSKLEAEYEDRKEAAAEAKKEFEKAEQHLRKLIRDRASDRGQPSVFDKKFTDGDDSASDAKPAEAPAGQPSGDYGELWQQFPMTFERWERFGLTKKDVERLNSGETKNFGVCPIVLFGDVSRFITPNASNPSFTRALKDFKGFGDKGAQRYADAELAFWKAWAAGLDAEFAAEKGVQANGPEAAAGTGSEDPQPVAEPIGEPVGDTEAVEQPAEADDSRPLSDAAEPAHPDVDIPKPKKRGRPKKQPAGV